MKNDGGASTFSYLIIVKESASPALVLTNLADCWSENLNLTRAPSRSPRNHAAAHSLTLSSEIRLLGLYGVGSDRGADPPAGLGGVSFLALVSASVSTTMGSAGRFDAGALFDVAPTDSEEPEARPVDLTLEGGDA